MRKVLLYIIHLFGGDRKQHKRVIVELEPDGHVGAYGKHYRDSDAPTRRPPKPPPIPKNGGRRGK